ncbi:MAG: hypothetical protein V9G04_03055 [Nocardioides sp.]
MAVSATAFERTSLAKVSLPSGVLTLGLAPDLAEVESGDDTLTPATDVTLIGVTWTFEQHRNSNTFDVILNGSGRQALPVPTLQIADGDAGIDLPGDVESSGGAVAGVESGSSALQVEYDGIVASVDLASGTVNAGKVEGLEDLEALETRKFESCPSRDFPVSAVLDHACGIEAVFRVPFINGLGWAPSDNGWLVVDTRVQGGPAKVTINGERGEPLAQVGQGIERLAFGVIGGSKTVEFDFGGDVGVVSARLPD